MTEDTDKVRQELLNQLIDRTLSVHEINLIGLKLKLLEGPKK